MEFSSLSHRESNVDEFTILEAPVDLSPGEAREFFEVFLHLPWHEVADQHPLAGPGRDRLDPPSNGGNRRIASHR